MCWCREMRVGAIVFIRVAVRIRLLVVRGVRPCLWLSHDHALVRALLELLSGGHLEGASPETGALA
jgi:hypothetical protein